MRAVVFHRYGAPERLSLQRVPRPVPGDGDVLVRIVASTVTRTDTATVRAHPFFARLATGLVRPKMRTLGMDFAGTVESVGRDVRAYRPGDRVFGLSPDHFGTHAEYLCVPADGPIAPIPADLGFHAAVVGEGAWYASGTTRHLEPNQSCLIYGASGAIGTAAVQLAKIRGAQVTAVVGTRHMELVARLGADRIVNYQAEDFTATDERFDLVMDAVGKTSWFACRPLLKKGGIFAATDLGPGWSNIVLSAWYGLTGRRKVIVPFPEDAPGFIRQLADYLADGRFRGVFDRDYPLEDVVEAFRYVERGHKTGIVTVTVGASD
ncbi:MAG: NAD(P)-dependent alcohol dehydrogenase [Sulfitobacter sp.]|nr:NAD(P)-dependent alcohol dehydrogenase [Sulfitobacter sp.]